MGSVRSVAVVGAGMVGLATAWNLQEHGVAVTVFDRAGVAAGASWGNAGWLTPALVAPLPEPAILRYGVRALLSSRSPVYAPLTTDADQARFMVGFLRNSTHRRWHRSLTDLLPLMSGALPAFDALAAAGVSAPTLPADPLVAAVPTAADLDPLTDELERICEISGGVGFEIVSGEAARRLQQILSAQVGAAVLIRGQRFLNPGLYVTALADAVRARGGEIVQDSPVSTLQDTGSEVVVTAGQVGEHRFDAAVLASGAWLGDLARAYGVRAVVQAGRGYSFSVQAEVMPSTPVYLPTARVAITPMGEVLRVAGMMELRRPDAGLDPRRIHAIVEAARPLLAGVDLDRRRDEWVGSRPVTADGLPLIGATSSSRVFVNGGHGMWGITLGPVTGALLAEQIATGTAPAALRPFDPLR